MSWYRPIIKEGQKIVNCLDCKHHQERNNAHFCLRPSMTNYGNVEPLNTLCSIERTNGLALSEFESMCGLKAKYFEPKEGKP